MCPCQGQLEQYLYKIKRSLRIGMRHKSIFRNYPLLLPVKHESVTLPVCFPVFMLAYLQISWLSEMSTLIRFHSCLVWHGHVALIVNAVILKLRRVSLCCVFGQDSILSEFISRHRHEWVLANCPERSPWPKSEVILTLSAGRQIF